MILVLSGGGVISSELYEFFESNNIPNIFYFGSFEDAGNFGKGNTIVGKASYRGFRRTLYKNKIHCVVDILSEPCSAASRAVMAATEDMNIPIVKFALPTMRLSVDALQGIADKAGISAVCDNSYARVAEKINNTVGNVLFLANPYNVRAIADLVFDRSALYVPISGGAEFDVELALEFGIPLMNVIAVDNFSGRAGIEKVINKVGAKILVTDSSSEIFDKLDAASETGCSVIFTQNTGLDYKHMANDFDSLKVILDKYACLDEAGHETEDSADESADSKDDVSMHEIH